MKLNLLFEVDRRIRELERQAASGDPSAIVASMAAKIRAGQSDPDQIIHYAINGDTLPQIRGMVVEAFSDSGNGG